MFVKHITDIKLKENTKKTVGFPHHMSQLVYISSIWVFPKIGENPQNGWFIMGKPYEQMDDLGGKSTIFGNTHILRICLVFLYVAAFFLSAQRENSSGILSLKQLHR